MAKSNAERQREYRLKAKGNFRKLEAMLPCNEFDLLHGNAKQAGKTKANYIVSLLHGNGVKDTVTANQDDKVLYGSEDLIEELKLIKQQVADGKGARLAIQRLKERVTELEQLKDSEELRTDTELRQRCNELVEENAKLRKATAAGALEQPATVASPMPMKQGSNPTASFMREQDEKQKRKKEDRFVEAHEEQLKKDNIEKMNHDQTRQAFRQAVSDRSIPREKQAAL